MKEKFDRSDIGYAIQFTVFYITVVAAIVFSILSIRHIVPFPILGVILVSVIAIVVQIFLMTIFAESAPDE